MGVYKSCGPDEGLREGLQLEGSPHCYYLVRIMEQWATGSGLSTPSSHNCAPWWTATFRCYLFLRYILAWRLFDFDLNDFFWG